VGNFIAGNDMKTEVEAGRCVVLDRYYASTNAYILGTSNVALSCTQRCCIQCLAGESFLSRHIRCNTSIVQATQRCFNSSCASVCFAFTLCLAYTGKKDLHLPLPNAGAAEYTWPVELYRPTFTCVLILPEKDRVARQLSRTSVEETPEERLLRETPAITQRISDVYMRMGCVPVYLENSDGVDRVVRKVLDAVNTALGCEL
jgi:thymidylate kinase